MESRMGRAATQRLQAKQKQEFGKMERDLLGIDCLI
jgi:hypothetical protein